MDKLVVSLPAIRKSLIRMKRANNPEMREGNDPNSVLVIGYLPELQHYVSQEPLER